MSFPNLLKTLAIECTDPYISLAVRWSAGHPVFGVSHSQKTTPGGIYFFAALPRCNGTANDPESNEQDMADEQLDRILFILLLPAHPLWPIGMAFY